MFIGHEEVLWIFSTIYRGHMHCHKTVDIPQVWLLTCMIFNFQKERIRFHSETNAPEQTVPF